MFLKDSFYGFAVQSSFIPESISFCLYFLGIEVSQHFFHFSHCLLASAIVEHL